MIKIVYHIMQLHEINYMQQNADQKIMQPQTMS